MRPLALSIGIGAFLWAQKTLPFRVEKQAVLAEEGIRDEVPKPIGPAQPVMDQQDKLYFIENKGQWSSEVLFLCRLAGLNAWITKQGVVYDFYRVEREGSPEGKAPEGKFSEVERFQRVGHVVIFRLVGANAQPVAEGREKQPEYYNYFLGSDPSRWVSRVGLYKEVMLRDVYPGVDMRYYFEGGSLRYDWVVRAGAAVDQIRFVLEGQEGDPYVKGASLCFKTRFGEVAMAELRSYQGSRGVASWFVRSGDSWRVALGDYDRTQDLVIDPLV
uniref:DUF7948 domain-containing protein n=1 Tax=uncultured Bacteroidota bacterium TaxID=152509 RepID=H5SIE5_9BACT|nr:hypothetical protein HGMM_F32H02C04 [uncultured Bacteroidetes bacterium]